MHYTRTFREAVVLSFMIMTLSTAQAQKAPKDDTAAAAADTQASEEGFRLELTIPPYCDEAFMDKAQYYACTAERLRVEAENLKRRAAVYVRKADLRAEVCEGEEDSLTITECEIDVGDMRVQAGFLEKEALAKTYEAEEWEARAAAVEGARGDPDHD